MSVTREDLYYSQENLIWPEEPECYEQLPASVRDSYEDFLRTLEY